MKDDIAVAKNNPELETLSFNVTKILPLPTSIAYYKRKLSFYNFSIHVGSTGQCMFNLWLEYQASNGTQEVGSCLKMYIQTIEKQIKKLILWSDSCGGQSIKLVLMMMHVLHNLSIVRDHINEVPAVRAQFHAKRHRIRRCRVCS